LGIVGVNRAAASNLVGSEVTKYVRHTAAAAAAKIARAARRKLIICISVAVKLPRWQPHGQQALPKNITLQQKRRAEVDSF
jgi:hypothetical protein